MDDSPHPKTKVKRIIWKCSKDRDSGKDSSEKPSSSTPLQDHAVKQRGCDSLRLMTASQTSYNFVRPCMMPLLPIPRVEECSSKASIVLTGTARGGGTGPPVGAVDIGVGRSAYYFRIALPGVKKDPGSVVLIFWYSHIPSQHIGLLSMQGPCGAGEFVRRFTRQRGEFSCEIKRDGQVHVRGITSTGGRTVTRYCRVFEMKTQHQCPPGPFTLSFSLPGPVDPRLFLPYFRSDGVFEAVVGKYEQ